MTKPKDECCRKCNTLYPAVKTNKCCSNKDCKCHRKKENIRQQTAEEYEKRIGVLENERKRMIKILYSKGVKSW